MLIRLAEFTYLQKDSPFELAMQGAPFLQGFGEHDINPVKNSTTTEQEC